MHADSISPWPRWSRHSQASGESCLQPEIILATCVKQPAKFQTRCRLSKIWNSDHKADNRTFIVIVKTNKLWRSKLGSSNLQFFRQVASFKINFMKVNFLISVVSWSIAIDEFDHLLFHLTENNGETFLSFSYLFSIA